MGMQAEEQPELSRCTIIRPQSKPIEARRTQTIASTLSQAAKTNTTTKTLNRPEPMRKLPEAGPIGLPTAIRTSTSRSLAMLALVKAVVEMRRVRTISPRSDHQEEEEREADHPRAPI